MNKKSLFSVGAGVVALLVAVPLAFANGPGGGRGCDEGGPGLERMTEKLGLDEAQAVTVKSIFEQHRAGMEASHGQLKAALDKVKAAWLAKDATEASVKAASREVEALQAKMAEGRIALGFKLKAVLTPAQFEKAVPRFMGGPGFGKRHHKGERGHRRGPVAGGAEGPDADG